MAVVFGYGGIANSFGARDFSTKIPTVVEDVTKGGLSMSRRRMRELERQQLEAIIRDDDEMIAILGPFLGR